MKSSKKEALAGILFISPSICGFMVFFMVPFVISLAYCFTDTSKKFVGFKNFIDLFGNSAFKLASINTLRFNLVSVPLIMLVSFLLALLLNRSIKGVTYFRTFFIIPLVVPVASVILVWNIIFSPNGVLNNLIMRFGIEPVNWLRSGWSTGVVALVYVWKNCGYNMVLFLAGLGNIPKEYYEAAYIDGAGPFTCLIKITLPYMVPTSFFVLIISIINSFKVFREVYLLAGKYPYQDIYLLQHFMNNNFFNLSYQKLTTAAFLMMVVICLMMLTLYRMESRFGRDLS
jgi:multiple sugar transport system permease protein